MNKKQIVGIVIFIILILIIIGIKLVSNNDGFIGNLEKVYIATGGGKEGFIADENVVNIMKQKYGLDVVYDSWSNGKLIKDPLVREVDKTTKYDAMFCSDQRFYDYYKLAPNKSARRSR